MEDDIDIEEHDVLEHPRIRNIFPDITQIKTEVPDEDYEDQTMDYAPYSDAEAADDEESSINARHGNKIILGSKPNNLHIQEQEQNGSSVLVFGRKSVEIKEEVVDDGYERAEPDEAAEEVLARSSVLIVGSKPSLPYSDHIQTSSLCDVNTEEKDAEEMSDDADNNNEVFQVSKDDIKDSVVLLENWGPRLERSSCYCKDCQILFPTPNTLQAHKMTTHSFLVAVDTNKAYKSTAKVNKSYANPNTPDNGRFCNHCQKIFPDPDSLINHLYKNLSFDESNPLLKEEDGLPTPQKVLVTPPKNIVKKEEIKPQVSQPFRPQTTNSVAQGSSNSKAIGTNLYCNICGFFFVRAKFYIKHVNKSHSSTQLNMERVPFNGRCPHCKSFFKTSYLFNQHIYRAHFAIYSAKGTAIQKTIPRPVNPVLERVHKYKCVKCNEVFPSYYSTRNHRMLKHPSLKPKQNIFLKITTSTTVPSLVAKKTVLPSKPPLKQTFQTQVGDNVLTANPPVPKSVLYKCIKCHLHFTSCTTGMMHTKNCLQNKDNWKCHICHRNFKVGNKLVHQLQHRHTSDFNVYDFEENIYGRVLNECPKCGLYFCEKKFFNHVKTECKGASVKCENCSLPIHISSIEEHRQWHEVLDLTKEFLILVEYVKQNNMRVQETGVKRELEEAESTFPKRQKVVPRTPERLRVYYCQYCCCYFVGVRHIKTHERGTCRTKSILGKRKICKSCGLMSSANTHDRIHEIYPGKTIFDIQFISVVGRRIINPPMPDFPNCPKCGVYFCRVSTVMAHQCTDSHKTCKVCSKTFSDLAYKLHMRFHEYPQKSRCVKPVATYMKRAVPGPSGSQQTASQELPELLKKYEMLTDIWQILYRCKTCDILYDTYDQAVDHCQKHFNNMESYDVTIKHCIICDLKFDSVCFNKHKELHEWNDKIRKGSFQILTFDYNELFTPKWFDMFSSAKVPKKQILLGSIYSHNRNVKLRVLNDGPPDSIVFRCARCDLHVHQSSLTDHVVVCNGKAASRYVCPLKSCRLQFCGPLVRDIHQALHKSTKTFKTVLFNEEGDKEFNETLRQNNAGTQTNLKSDNTGRFHYYQCMKCKCCSDVATDRRAHRCHYGNNRKRCEKCKLTFTKNNFPKHETLHKTVRLIRKMIKITLFNPQPNIAQKYKSIRPLKFKTIVRLYKCSCGLHFTSTNAIESHSELCSQGANVSKEKCSKCSRLFDTAQLVTHLCKHHRNDKNTTFEVVAWNKGSRSVPKYSIFQCSACESLFISKHAFTLHESECGQNSNCCGSCGLKFQSTLTHLLKHKDCSKLSLDDYDITVLTPVKDKSKIVYKCADCEVYYLSYGGLLYHINDANHDMAKVAPCPKCGLNFMPLTLAKHISIHHKKHKFTRKDLIIETVPFKVDKLLPDSVKKYDYDYNNLYKCHVCKMHFVSPHSLRSHFTRAQHDVKPASCKICGYVFSVPSLKRHQYIHHVKNKLKRRNFKLKSVVGLNKIVDYVSDGEHEKCAVAKPRKVEPMQVDEDTKDSENSKSMQLVYDEDGSDMELSDVSNDATTSATDPLKNSPKPKPFNNKMKGQIIKIENLLYKCGNCTLHFLNQLSVISHLGVVHTAKAQVPAGERCDICQLDFTDSSFKRHITIHHENQKVTKTDMYVITISKFTEKEGVSSNHLFQCNICYANFVKVLTLNDHMKTIGEHKEPSYSCEHCGLRFLTSHVLNRHVKDQHKKRNREAVCILQYYAERKLIVLGAPNTDSEDTESTQDNNDVVDDPTVDASSADESDTDVCNDTLNSVEIDERMTTTDAGNKDIPERKSFPPALSNLDLSLYSRNIYKCSVCSLHYLTQRGLLIHLSKHEKVPGKDKTKTACHVCGFTFTDLIVSKHVYVHHEQFKFSREDLNIIDETELAASKDGSVNLSMVDNVTLLKMLFHCEKCSSNFVVYGSATKHFTTCENTITKFKCDTCGLLFSKTTLTKHRKIHHEDNNFAFKDLIILNTDLKVVNLGQEHLTNTVESVQNVAEGKLKEITQKVSTLNTDLYTNKLYKCDSCSSHFLTADILECHTRNAKHDVEKLACTSCGYDFAVTDLATHVFIHHEKMALAAEDFEIISINEMVNDSTQNDDAAPDDDAQSNDNTEDSTDVKSLSSDVEIVEPITETRETSDADFEPAIEEDAGDVSEGSIHLILDGAEGSAIDDMASNVENTAATFESAEPLVDTEPSIDTEECKVDNASQDNAESIIPLTETINPPKKNEQDISTESPREQTSQNTSTTGDSDKKSYKIKLYKCGECNVCFLTQRICYKHVIKHVPLDPKEYIECKLCGFQFIIKNNTNNGLASHITKHHNEPFKLEEVLVEEYHPNILCHGTPKLELYNGIDKIQSKLVSTTSEGNVSSDFDSENEKDASKTSELPSEEDAEKMSFDEIVVLD